MNTRASKPGARRWRLLIPLVAVVAGCGGASSATHTFVGTWSYTKGTHTTTCGSAPSQVEPLSGRAFTVLADTHPGALVLIDDLPCAISFFANGDMASLTWGTCTAPHDASGTEWILHEDWTLTLLDGDTLQSSDSGFFGPTGTDCSFDDVGTVTRVN
jgi:hypothetical protein